MTKEQKEVLQQALYYLAADEEGWHSENDYTRCNDLYEKVFGRRLNRMHELSSRRVGAEIITLAIAEEGFFEHPPIQEVVTFGELYLELCAFSPLLIMIGGIIVISVAYAIIKGICW